MLDRGLLAYDALVAARAAASRPPLAYGVDVVPREPRRRRTSRPPATRPTRCARSRPASGTPRREPAARAVLVRPRHRPARGHHAHLQHGDRRRQPARVPVRRPRPRAALRRPPGGRREHRRHRRRGASGCTARSGGRCCARSTATARYAPGVAPLRLTRAPRGVGASASGVGARLRRARSPTCACAARVRARGHARRPARYRFTPRLDRGALDAPRAAAPRRATVTFPSWGRAARVEATLADGRTVALGRMRRSPACASLHVLSERSGYRVSLRGAGHRAPGRRGPAALAAGPRADG